MINFFPKNIKLTRLEVTYMYKFLFFKIVYIMKYKLNYFKILVRVRFKFHICINWVIKLEFAYIKKIKNKIKYYVFRYDNLN